MVEKNVNLVVGEEQKTTLFLVHDERMETKENMLYLDNGASNDMCGDKDKFMDLDESIKNNVIFVYHSKVFIKGKCMIMI
jgi:hypothetical protein